MHYFSSSISTISTVVIIKALASRPGSSGYFSSSGSPSTWAMLAHDHRLSILTSLKVQSRALLSSKSQVANSILYYVFVIVVQRPQLAKISCVLHTIDVPTAFR